ncbi:hypothetical protein [Metapseudomonas otitidis]|uniref:hypothetical protein n=1 Tax=Metapseudomonas otitidis TaxID=319939 RepID=UPI0013F671E8|nr:hypothetical protein [Pseudomonas otitidis]
MLDAETLQEALVSWHERHLKQPEKCLLGLGLNGQVKRNDGSGGAINEYVQGGLTDDITLLVDHMYVQHRRVILNALIRCLDEQQL